MSPPDGSIWIDLSQSKYISTNINTFILKVHSHGNISLFGVNNMSETVI